MPMRVAKAFVYDDQGYALVLYRSASHPSYAHEADLPGGIIEPSESFEAGMARELREETGIVVGEGELALLSRKRSVTGAMNHLYIVRMKERPEVVVSWEHEGFAWVKPETLAGILQSRDAYMRFVRGFLRVHLPA